MITRVTRQKGFTLLEILVAAAIFTVIGVVCYQFISTLDKVDSRTAHRVEHLKKLQRVFMLMDQDFLQVISRPVRNPDQPEAWKQPVQGNESFVQITRSGVPNTLGTKKSNISRIEYGFNGEEALVLRVWHHLDGGYGEEPSEMEILDEVSDVKIRYLELEKGNGAERKFNWRSQWPPETETGSGLDVPQPVAVEVTLNSLYLGEIKRFFQVTDNEFLE